ncbi:hypothetical protein FDECE_5208 [Fusarium decemcellulare]|nr:hypothetical protein FDECE_5208 [Fusarium decemcellulare]
MLLFSILAIFFVALASAVGATQCPPGAHIIVVRGSLEPQGPGIMGDVARKILKRIPDSDMESLIYPALYEPYVPSQVAGVENMTQLVHDYSDRCPQTKMIILGYSQGAHVTMDVMCGASSDGFPKTVPQSTFISDNISAMILMGDPSLTAGQPFTVGSSHGSGIFPRHLVGGCQSVSDKAISICDAGDPFCEAGGHDLKVHMAYVAVWGDYAVDHAVSLFRSAQD